MSVYNLLLILLPSLTIPYVSRVFGAELIGFYSYTQSIQYFFFLFAALGTIAYGTTEIAKVQNDVVSRSILFWEIELFSCVTTCIILLAWICLSLFTNANTIIFLIWSINIFSVLFDISWFFLGLEKFIEVVKVNSICKIVGVVSVFIFVKTPNDLYLYVLITGLTAVSANLSMWFFLFKYITKIKIVQLQIMRHLKPVLIYFIPTISGSVYTVFDKTLIGLLSEDHTQNGYYELATKIITVFKMMTYASINSVLLPRLSSLYSQGKFDEMKQKIKLSVNFISAIGVGFLFGTLANSYYLVPCVLGKNYDPVIILLYLMSGLPLIIGISTCLINQYYIPSGKRMLSAKFIMVGAFVNFILNLVFIPICSSRGATIASVFAESIIAFLCIKYCNGFFNFKYLLSILKIKFIAGFCMLCTIIIYCQYFSFHVSTEYMLISNFIIGVFSYFIFLCVFHDSVIDFIKRKNHLKIM